MAEKSVQMTISGRVQGVFFRKHTVDQARKLNISGYVKNLPDGSVMVEMHGDSQSVDKLIAWCRVGPPSAKVEEVRLVEIPAHEYPTFTIRW